MTKKKTKALELTPEQANALMVMLDSDIETTFNSSYGGIDPIADWEFVDGYAYQLLAYQKYKEWYMENHND
tara:strand:+ start:1580 stop:1792 length:213 start_codon:yes stop_codon:yes gene_type:complete